MVTWKYRHLFFRIPGLDLENRLNTLGKEGWELVSMEPHWEWEKESISLAMDIIRPVRITGWYCTFKKASEAPPAPVGL